LELIGSHRVLGSENDCQRDKQSQCGGDLDEARVITTPMVGRMLGHVNGGAAVLTAQGQTLENPDDDERYRCKPTRGLERRQQSDQGSGSAHDGERYQESVLAANDVADAA